ncbi:MAG: pilus assembly protein PilM [Sedimentisphaerales bacterium]|nr:pilus assembly protein PilM [Sedimentisphaerales bacterium]
MMLFGKRLGQTQAGLVGLDIGSSSVKLVRLDKNSKGWSASTAAYAVIESSQDQTLRDENTVRAIQKCFHDTGTTGLRSAVCSISGQDVAVRGFSFPTLPDEAIEQAVKLEAQQLSALDPNHSVVDYQLLQDVGTPAEPARQGRKGYLVIGLEDAIQRKIRTAQQAQVKPVLMDVNSLAILNCLGQLPENQGADTFAALDVGYTVSTLTILGKDGVPFVRNLSGTAQQILTMISVKMQTSVAEVRKNLSQENKASDSALEVELKNSCGKLTGDVLETLRFYSLQPNTERVCRLYLCGGFALYQPFVRLMQQALPIPVNVFNPLDVISCPPDSPTRKTFEQFGPAMSVAAGLAMRSLQ